MCCRNFLHWKIPEPYSTQNELMFVVGCRKWWMNQPDLLPEEKPLVCTRQELFQITKLCDPLSKILYVQYNVRVAGFTVKEGFKGAEKMVPVLQSLARAFPHLEITIQPIHIENPWNDRWEHTVTVRPRRIQPIGRDGAK